LAFPASLGRRLLLILAAAMLVALVITVYSLLEYVDKEAEEVLDARLTLTAENLLRQARRQLREGNLNEVWLTLETVRGLENAWLAKFANSDRIAFGPDDHSADDKARSYIWMTSGDGKVIVGQVLPGYNDHHSRSKALRTIHYDDAEWRVAEVHEDGLHLHVAQREDLRAYLVREIGWKLMEKQLIAIPLIVLVLWFGIRRGLRPLSRLSEQIASRKPDNLKPVELDQVPVEIVPLVESINRLLDRLEAGLESERRFTSDAAHELRSPLAVVRNVARILAGAHSLQEVQSSALLLDKSAVRMADLLSQLLHLARLDSLLNTRNLQPFVLSELMRDVIGGLLPRAASRDMNLSYVAEHELRVTADRDLLHLMFHNIVGNAIKYGRSEVEVHAVVQEQLLVVKVLDDGPGVDDEELAQLFERFFRGQDAKQQAEGSGLGLSIVRRVAELHGFSVAAFNREEGGLCVGVHIPAGSWKSQETPSEQG
jgi:two-component system sensor histidine kinase QseC